MWTNHEKLCWVQSKNIAIEKTMKMIKAKKTKKVCYKKKS